MLHLGDPKQWNRYVYVACNPINAIDPSGTACDTDAVAQQTGSTVLSGLALFGATIAVGLAPEITVPVVITYAVTYGTFDWNAYWLFRKLSSC